MKQSKSKHFGDRQYNPMMDFKRLRDGSLSNRLGLSPSEVKKLKKRHNKKYHELKGKLMSSLLQADPKWIKLVQNRIETTYKDDNAELARKEALKDIAEEIT